LPRELQSTLEMLRVGPLTARQLYISMGASGSRTAANNRLEKLRRLDYAWRERQGKQWVYRAT
jgi:hypothetical protein